MPRVQVPKILRTLVPNTMRGMVLGARALQYWVLGPFGPGMRQAESVGLQLTDEAGLGSKGSRGSDLPK